MPKRTCAQRAEWRLLPGKGAEALSPHYRLDCDFGTPVIAIYKTGEGNDPVYLCANHVGEVRPVQKKLSDIRFVEAPAETVIAAPREPVVQAPETAVAKTAEAAPAKVNVPALKPQPVSVSAPRPQRITAVRAPARDLTYGNAAKALVDEAIWNLAVGDYELYRTALQRGMSPGDAAQAAGGQLAIVHRKICEYTVKLETVLAASTAKISAHDAIDAPFERAILDMINSSAIADTERDAAIDQLGALQASVNRGLEREITPLQAQRVALSIAERANWGASTSVSEALKQAHRAVYGSVRSSLRAAVPHANSLEERLTNLYAAKSDLENAPAATSRQNPAA